MSGKNSVRIVDYLERARIEGHWSQVSQYAEQLPREFLVLKYVSLGECVLQQQLLEHCSQNTLHLAKGYITKALSQKSDADSQFYKEAILLQAKTFFIQAKFRDCLDTLEKVDMEKMRNDVLTFNVSRALADAYAYKGMCLEYLGPDDLDKVIQCYESAGDIGLELLNSISKSSLNLTLSGVLEIALIRSVILQLSKNKVEQGVKRLRKILQLSDVSGSDNLRLSICITLAQVLLRGLPDNKWVPLTCDANTDTLSKRSRTASTLKKYESVFFPCNKAEETILVTLISQAMLYKEGCDSVRPEEGTKHTKTQVHYLVNLLISLLSKYPLYRPLSDFIENFLKFSYDDPHLIKQFGLCLIASEQYVRGCAMLEKCCTSDVAIILVLIKTYINHLQKYEHAISLCNKYLEETNVYKSRLYLLRGVAQAAVCRSSRLTEEQKVYNRKAIESLFKAYSLDPHCHTTLYHLALRLASVGEIKKSMRFTKKVMDNKGVVNLIDSSHLLALVLSAQNKLEEALDMITLTLYDYPENLNLIITKVMLEKHVHGSYKALITCKEVLLPLLDKFGYSVQDSSLFLPYSDQWTSGKFQLTQWSDRVSTQTNVSISGSQVGTLPAAESICESIDSGVGFDNSNWGYQAEVWYTIADIFLAEGMLRDAEKCLEEVKSLFPLSHLVSYMCGRIKQKQGWLMDAEQQYINAVTLSPSHIPSLVELGKLQMELDKPLLADYYLTQATKCNPSEYEAWFSLGCLHQKQGSHRKAAEFFLTALWFEYSASIRPYFVLKWNI